jgi:hypothetical protein
MEGRDQLRKLQRLWPNRTHESNWLKDAICAMGFHRWYALEASDRDATLKCSFCRWCAKLRVLDAGRSSNAETCQGLPS